MNEKQPNKTKSDAKPKAEPRENTQETGKRKSKARISLQ